MGRLAKYDTEQRLAIGTGAGIGIAGFALWLGLEPSGLWGIVGIGLLFVGGVVSGTGSLGFKQGIRDAVPAMVLILLGETVVMTIVVAARPGTGGPEAILVGVFATVILFWLVGSLLFAPFLLLAGVGGWVRGKVSGPVEEGETATGTESGARDGTDAEWRRTDEY